MFSPCCCKLFSAHTHKPGGILTWIPVESSIGTLLCLDSSCCYGDSLMAMSYIRQSDSYAFKPGCGGVGRCYSEESPITIAITKKTQYETFHRVGLALQSCIAQVYFQYEGGVVKEYLNTDESYGTQSLYGHLEATSCLRTNKKMVEHQ